VPAVRVTLTGENLCVTAVRAPPIFARLGHYRPSSAGSLKQPTLIGSLAKGQRRTGVTYEISMPITLTREAYDVLGDIAAARGNKLTTLLRNYVAADLRDYLRVEETA
jgi:hypothetical protein